VIILEILKTIYNVVMKQYKVDTGQLGGLYSVTLQTFVFVTLITFINTFITAYQSFWQYHISLPALLLIVFVIAFVALWFVHAILYPSIVQFANRQAYTLNDSPMQRDILEIKETLKQIQDKQ